MSDLAEVLLSRVDQRLAEMGKSRYWLSKEASEGKSTKVLADVERRRAVPKEARLRRIAELLDVSVDWLMGRTENRAPVRSEVGLLHDVRLDFRHEPGEPGIPVVGTGDCADLTVEDDEGHKLQVERSSFDPDYHVTFVTRPPALRGDRQAYAIYFHGSSMEPRYYAGEIGIVQPSRHAGPGDFVVAQLREEGTEEVVSVLVKRLVRSTTAYIELEQFNPPLTFRLPRAKVKHIHRIVPPSELLW